MTGSASALQNTVRRLSSFICVLGDEKEKAICLLRRNVHDRDIYVSRICAAYRQPQPSVMSGPGQAQFRTVSLSRAQMCLFSGRRSAVLCCAARRASACASPPNLPPCISCAYPAVRAVALLATAPDGPNRRPVVGRRGVRCPGCRCAWHTARAHYSRLRWPPAATGWTMMIESGEEVRSGCAGRVSECRE